MWRGSRVSDRTGFDRIVGQDTAKRVLVRAVREGSPTHAYLFLGLEGTGKCATAIEFARALNCEDPREGHACGECGVCRTIDHGNFPDVRVWSPDGQNTKIEQMREMRDSVVFKPVRGRWKINIVEQGDTLNDESANCILKLLEEPPPYLVNILLFRNAAAVLPTIRSRCQMVRFTQVSASELVDRLLEDFGLPNDEARFLAAYSQGCPGKAIRLIGNESFFARREEIVGAASALTSGGQWLALKLAEVLRGPNSKQSDEKDDEDEPDAPAVKQPKRSKRDAAVESLDMLLLWYRDLLAARLQGGEAALVNIDKRDDILLQCERYPHAGHIAAAVEAILQAKRAVLGNANPQIVTEALMMRLAV